MQESSRTNEKAFLNTVKETTAYNLQNIYEISSGLWKYNLR